MNLRLRLIVAFLLLSVVPLGAVTLYSYRSSAEALRAAAERETDLRAGELAQRMSLVTAQLSERVEHLADVAELERQIEVANEQHARADATNDSDSIGHTVASALGEAAVLLNNVELLGVRGRGRFMPPGPPDAPGPPGSGRSRQGDRTSGPPPEQAGMPRPDRGGLLPADRAGMPPPDRSGMPPPAPSTPVIPTAPPPPAAGAQPGTSARTEVSPAAGRGDRDRSQRDGRSSGQGRGAASSSGAARGSASTSAVTSVQTEQGSSPEKILIDLSSVRRDIARAIIPDGKQFENLTPEQRERLGREINARMLGIVEGIKLGATELQKQADAKQRQAAAAARQKTSTPAAIVKKAEAERQQAGGHRRAGRQGRAAGERRDSPAERARDRVLDTTEGARRGAVCRRPRRPHLHATRKTIARWWNRSETS